MHTLYRLSSIGNSLPVSWCYDDVEASLIGAKPARGAQCWDRATKILTASTGHEDGDYGLEQGYDRVLVIEAASVVDGGDWDAVTESEVLRVWSLPLAELVEDAIKLLDPEGEEIEDDLDLADWLVERDLDNSLDDVDAMIHALMLSRAIEIKVNWIDTLSA